MGFCLLKIIGFTHWPLSRPGLLTYGSPLGLEHIEAEPSTIDGTVLSALESDVPDIIGGTGAVIRASDGLQFATRDAL